jgi:hypothetical protein
MRVLAILIDLISPLLNCMSQSYLTFVLGLNFDSQTQLVKVSSQKVFTLLSTLYSWG